MPRSLTGAMLTVMLALALIALPLADASKLTIPAEAQKAGIERVRARILHVTGSGSFKIDCSGDGTINYYTDAQCTLIRGVSESLATLTSCDESRALYKCAGDTPKFTYYADPGCTGSSIAGMGFLDTSCHTQADFYAYVTEFTAEYNTMAYKDMAAINCGDSCAKPASATMYSLCQAAQAGRAYGCFDDCASVPPSDLVDVNYLLDMCGVQAIVSAPSSPPPSEAEEVAKKVAKEVARIAAEAKAAEAKVKAEEEARIAAAEAAASAKAVEEMRIKYAEAQAAEARAEAAAEAEAKNRSGSRKKERAWFYYARGFYAAVKWPILWLIMWFATFMAVIVGLDSLGFKDGVGAAIFPITAFFLYQSGAAGAAYATVMKCINSFLQFILFQ